MRDHELQVLYHFAFALRDLGMLKLGCMQIHLPLFLFDQIMRRVWGPW